MGYLISIAYCLFFHSALNFHMLLIEVILSFQTDWSGQIVQTQIRLLLEEQSDQGLHYLQYCLHLLDALRYGKKTFFEF